MNANSTDLAELDENQLLDLMEDSIYRRDHRAIALIKTEMERRGVILP